MNRAEEPVLAGGRAAFDVERAAALARVELRGGDRAQMERDLARFAAFAGRLSGGEGGRRETLRVLQRLQERCFGETTCLRYKISRFGLRGVRFAICGASPKNTLRADEPGWTLPREELLQGAPFTARDCFLVPQVVRREERAGSGGGQG